MEGGLVPRLEGELDIVVDFHPVWPTLSLESPEFGLFGSSRRYKLVGVQVGAQVYYDMKPNTTPLRHVEGLVNFDDDSALQRVFKDLSRLKLYCYVDLGVTKRFLAATPNLDRLAIIFTDTENDENPSIASYTELIEERATASGRDLSHLALVCGPWRWHTARYGWATQELILPISSANSSALYVPESHCDPEDIHGAWREGPAVTKAVLCIGEECCNTNPMQAACEIMAVWGSGVQVELQPCFEEPDEQLLTWMRHVTDIRLTLLRMASGENGPGWTHEGESEEESEESGDSEN